MPTSPHVVFSRNPRDTRICSRHTFTSRESADTFAAERREALLAGGHSALARLVAVLPEASAPSYPHYPHLSAR